MIPLGKKTKLRDPKGFGDGAEAELVAPP